MNDSSKEEESQDPFILQNQILFKKFKPIKLIGKGTFSNVYISLNTEKNNYVAIKTEKRFRNGVELLESEAFFLYSLRGFGIPEVISFGRTKTHNILVLPLLGKSLLDLFIFKNKNIDINDICLMALQIIDRIEWVHSKYIVYRDIKPENFLFGKNDPEVLYLIDFGLCRKYKSSKTDKHILPKNLGKFTGTSRYASVYSMAGNEQSRRDDIESIGYMIIFLMKKKLPWQGIKGNSYKECYHKLYLMKKYIEIEDLCKGLPKEISDYMYYAKALKFEQEPDYKYLRGLFNMILKANNFNFERNTFSWIKNPNNESSRRMNTMSKFSRKSSPHKRLFEKIQESIEKKRNKQKLKQSDKTDTDYSSSNTKQNNMIFLNSIPEKINNEGNSEISHTMQVMYNKNINSGYNENIGTIPRIASDKNIYKNKLYSFRMSEEGQKMKFRNNHSPSNIRTNNNIFSINKNLLDIKNSDSEESYRKINQIINNDINNNNNELKKIFLQKK